MTLPFVVEFLQNDKLWLSKAIGYESESLSNHNSQKSLLAVSYCIIECIFVLDVKWWITRYKNYVIQDKNKYEM